jgi:hypothetical protein
VGRKASDGAEDERVIGRERRVVEAPVREVVEVPGRRRKGEQRGGAGGRVEEGGGEGRGGEREPMPLSFEVASQRGSVSAWEKGQGSAGVSQQPHEQEDVPE